MRFLDVFSILLELKYCLNVFITQLELSNISTKQTVGMLFQKRKLGRGSKIFFQAVGRFPMGTKYPFVQTAGLCKRVYFALLPADNSDKQSSLVSARKGKNKGKYIRFEHLTGETP